MGSYPYGAPPPSEQLWREEVLYLHSLWHQGPPRNPNSKLNSNNFGASSSPTPKPNSENLGASSSPTPKPNSGNLGASSSPTPKPNSENLGASSSSTPKSNSGNLGVSNPTTFKKRKNKRRGAKKKKDPEPIVSEVEWACGSDPPEPCQGICLPESIAQSDQAKFSTPKPDSENLCSSSSSMPKSNSGNLGASNSGNLGASNPTTFKKRKNKRTGAKKKKAPEPIVSEVEWVCGSNPPEPCQETCCPESNPHQATRPATAEEQAKSAALYLQQNGLKACQDFFSSKVCADDNEEEEELRDDDVNESEEFKFFMGIFTDDINLRDYYEKNWDSGEFCCLVCGGTGKKLSKKFKNCVALVQHSTAISKTKRKLAHRAYGRAICQVFGREIHQLPSIVVSFDGPLGSSMAKAESVVGFNQKTAQKEELRENFIDLVDDSDGEVDPTDHGVIVLKEDLRGKVVESVTVVKDEQIDIQEGSMKNDGLHEKETVVKDEQIDIQKGSMKNDGLHEKELDGESC